MSDNSGISKDLRTWLKYTNMSDEQIMDPQNWDGNGNVPNVASPDEARMIALQNLQQYLNEDDYDKIINQFNDKAKYLNIQEVKIPAIKEELQNIVPNEKPLGKPLNLKRPPKHLIKSIGGGIAGPKRPIPVKIPKSATLEQKYADLANIVKSLGYDIKRVREADTINGAKYFADKENERLGKDIYKVHEDDIDHDGIPEIYIDKKYYNPVTRQYTENYEPYIINGYKLQGKDPRRRWYMDDYQKDLNFGEARRDNIEKYMKEHNGQRYPNYKDWVNHRFYNRIPDKGTQEHPLNPRFNWKYERTDYPESMYELAEQYVTPKTKRSARQVFQTWIAELVKNHFGDDAEARKNYYKDNGGYMNLVNDLYNYHVATPLIAEYDVDPSNEKLMKKLKSTSQFKQECEAIVEDLIVNREAEILTALGFK